MKKLPIVHVMDDPCNAVRYSLHKYPDICQEAFGTYKGCFEVPSETELPTEGVDCPDHSIDIESLRKRLYTSFSTPIL